MRVFIGRAGVGVTLAVLLGLFMALRSSAQISFCPLCLAGQCNAPAGIAIDRASGRVYVADSGNSRVNAFDANGPLFSLSVAPALTRASSIVHDG